MEMKSEDVFAICERVAELQALLHDYAECRKHSAADVVSKAQKILSEPELLQAMFDVGYFPPSTPTNRDVLVSTMLSVARGIGNIE
jgi:hypothetical protein